ncbi:hypothetical protein CRE_21174 [Caenorhabditis remanei]|uniref:Uncharacterized protein n=1 Tax=Caenorhabditis remanei TaxID=31234 RepID=E3MF50_CAERE|nr:hypothetical protein CRE_21174 [Caenorhabditis remanei]
MKLFSVLTLLVIVIAMLSSAMARPNEKGVAVDFIAEINGSTVIPKSRTPEEFNKSGV